MKKKIIEITSLEELMEMSAMSGGAVAGHSSKKEIKEMVAPETAAQPDIVIIIEVKI